MCVYDIEVPANHTIKLTCASFMMQGGQNCSHDHIMVDVTGDTDFSNGQKFCGLGAPDLVSNGTRMTIRFHSDDLFRYQGFNCRYRALQPNGNAVIGSFGNTTENKYPSGNNFLQVVQCPNMASSSVSLEEGGEGGASASTGTSLYSGTVSYTPLTLPTKRIV